MSKQCRAAHSIRCGGTTSATGRRLAFVAGTARRAAATASASPWAINAYRSNRSTWAVMPVRSPHRTARTHKASKTREVTTPLTYTMPIPPATSALALAPSNSHFSIMMLPGVARTPLSRRVGPVVVVVVEQLPWGHHGSRVAQLMSLHYQTLR